MVKQVKPVVHKQKRQQFKCRRKGCLYKTFSKFQLKRHSNKECALLPRLTKKKTHSNTSQLDLKSVKFTHELGSGRFGTVFLARLGAKQIVAKRTQLHQQNLIESFENELEFYKQFQKNDNIKGFPEFYGHLKGDGVGYLFFERLSCSLDYLIKQHDWESHQFASLMISVLTQLKKLHELGWVHRDLKFNNVMVKGSAIYLIDFGAAYKPPVKKNCGSVYGNLRFLSENAHSYFQQTFTDDIQSIGWMFLEMVTPELSDLPWMEAYTNYKNGQIEYDEANSLTAERKSTFLKDPNSENEINSFAFKFLNEVRNEAYPSSAPIQLYNKLFQMLKQEMKGKKHSYHWRNKTVIKTGAQLAHQVVLFPMTKSKYHHNSFFDDALNADLRSKYLKKQQLTSFDIESNCPGRYGMDYQYLNLGGESAKNRFKKIACSSEKKIWILRTGSWLEPHFSTYLTYQGMAISFNGINSEPEEVMNLLVVKGKQYGSQTDDWSCGYRALFWVSQLLMDGRIDKEISELQ